MKLTFKLEPQDIVALSRLSMRPRPWLAKVGLCLIALVVAFIAFHIYEWAVTGTLERSAIYTFAAIGYLALIFFVTIPWRSKRHFRQHKALHHEIHVELGDEKFLVTSVNGTSGMPWGDLHKWKASTKVIALYHSDLLCNAIPRRAFASDAEFKSALAFLENKMGPQKV